MPHPFVQVPKWLSIWLLTMISVGIFAAQPEPKELFWEDMVPKGFIAPEVTVDHLNNMSQAAPNAPVLPELNGQYVKIPGFVVPLRHSRTDDGIFVSPLLWCMYSCTATAI